MSAEEDAMADAWRQAGFKVIGGGRPFWTQKRNFIFWNIILWVIAFGFIGYCVGSPYPIRAQLVLVAVTGLAGAIMGAGQGLLMVYTCRAVASRKLGRILEKK